MIKINQTTGYLLIVTLSSLLILTLSSFEKGDSVYIVPNGLVYHNNRNCRGLSHSKDIILCVSRSSALDQGRKECRICNIEDSIKLGKKFLIYMNSKHDKYHLYPDCDSLGGSGSFTSVYITPSIDSLCILCLNRKNNAQLQMVDSQLNEESSHLTPIGKDILLILILLTLLILLLIFRFKIYPSIFEKWKSQSSRNVLDLNESSKFCYKIIQSETDYISSFLKLFKIDDKLKYTTHYWDRDELKNISFDEFRNSYLPVLMQWEDRISVLKPKLWNTIENFLIKEDNVLWGEHNLKCGYDHNLKAWMDKNPGKKPSDMPLISLPKECRPGLIENRALSTFKDVIHIFKQCIEFRDNDLLDLLEDIFDYDDKLKVDIDKNIEGTGFYTYTPCVKNALLTIKGNITDHNINMDKHVDIKLKRGCENDKQKYILEIIDNNSYSNIDIDKMFNTNGMKSICEELKNLCEFSVESIFTYKGNKTPLRINYLVNNTHSVDCVQEIPTESCVGFKYILTFSN